MPDLVRPINLRKPIVNRKLIAWVFVVTGILSIIFWLIGKKNQGLWTMFKPTTVTFDLTPQKLPVAAADTSSSDATVVAQLQDQTSKLDGEFSIYVYRPAAGVGYGFAADKIRPAVSIMKVPIMLATLKKIEAGIITLDDNYTLQDADKQEGSGPIHDMPAGTKLTVRFLLQKMGQNSDNTAPVVLTNLIGADYIQSTIKSLGMTNTSFAQNTTTALDLTHMWSTVYTNHFLKDQSLTLMEQDLSNSVYEDRIPSGLPKGTKVIHKVGSGDNVWADTAVINSKLYVTILDDGVSLGQVGAAFPDLVKTIWNYESLQ